MYLHGRNVFDFQKITSTVELQTVYGDGSLASSAVKVTYQSSCLDVAQANSSYLPVERSVCDGLRVLSEVLYILLGEDNMRSLMVYISYFAFSSNYRIRCRAVFYAQFSILTTSQSKNWLKKQLRRCIHLAVNFRKKISRIRFQIFDAKSFPFQTPTSFIIFTFSISFIVVIYNASFQLDSITLHNGIEHTVFAEINAHSK